MLLLPIIHAVYFFLTGIWPLVHMPSFIKVTGPKVDLWLVRTVGALVSVIGAVIGLASLQKDISGPIVLLGIGSAASLMLIDVIYVTRGVISKIYLGDAVLEVLLILGWIVLLAVKD